MMDSQNFYSLSAADPERLAQNGESSQTGRSQDDAIYIEDCDSDDDETYVSGDDQIDDSFPSVYGLIRPTAEHRDAGFGNAPVSLDNGQSNTVSPSVNELRLLNLGRDSNTGADVGLAAAFPASGKEGLRELSLNERIEPADGFSSNQQQKEKSSERPQLPPSTLLIINEGDAGDEVAPSPEQEAPVQEHPLMPLSGPSWLRQSPACATVAPSTAAVNVQLHLSTEDGCHRLTAVQFCDQLREQLACDLDENCDTLDKFGKFGAIGMLFRLKLPGHGYCVAAKGVQPAHASLLEQETAVYGHLHEQQGTLVPVCLDMIELMNVYRTSFGAHISHMMVMSYAGEPIVSKAVAPMPENIGSLGNNAWVWLRQLGVEHRDEHGPNLWNAV
ncbi:hypothetical protein SEUCBS140593_005357 [Sporothrix eucalyptigena]|uniref:Protein kinase domain-containing protein n=1 Tax=Sporothrix eucalyptigena TaxID=1812306 RepID=A0ABP0BVN2_9PEZI